MVEVYRVGFPSGGIAFNTSATDDDLIISNKKTADIIKGLSDEDFIIKCNGKEITKQNFESKLNINTILGDENTNS